MLHENIRHAIDVRGAWLAQGNIAGAIGEFGCVGSNDHSAQVEMIRIAEGRESAGIVHRVKAHDQ